MTNKQYKLCKLILKKKKLNLILAKSKLTDHYALQYEMPPSSIGYMEIPVTDTTEVVLEKWMLEEYEARRRNTRDQTWTRILAVIGSITGIIGSITGIIALLKQ